MPEIDRIARRPCVDDGCGLVNGDAAAIPGNAAGHGIVAEPQFKLAAVAVGVRGHGVDRSVLGGDGDGLIRCTVNGNNGRAFTAHRNVENHSITPQSTHLL